MALLCVASFFLPSIPSLLPSFLPSFLASFLSTFRLALAWLGFSRLGLASLGSAWLGFTRLTLLGLDCSASIGFSWLGCVVRLVFHRTSIYAPHVVMSFQRVGAGYTQVSWILKQPGHGFGRRCEVHPHFCLELRIWYNNLPVLLKYSSIQLTRGFPFTLPVGDSIGDCASLSTKALHHSGFVGHGCTHAVKACMSPAAFFIRIAKCKDTPVHNLVNSEYSDDLWLSVHTAAHL